MRDHGLERDQQAALADREEARQALGHLDPCEALLARLRVAHDDTEAEREARDVRERLPGPDRERGQHRVDLTREHRLELAQLVVGGVVDGADEDAFGGERGAELVAPELRLRAGKLEHAGAHLGERLLRRASVAASEPRRRPTTWSSRPATRTMKNSSRFEREDAAELDALEERLVRVGRELEHAAVQIEPGELAVQERLGRARQGQVAWSPGPSQHR